MNQEKAPDANTELANFQQEIEALSQVEKADIHLVGIDVTDLSVMDMQTWLTFKELEHSGFPNEFVKAFEHELNNVQSQENLTKASIDFIAFVRNRLVISANSDKINK